MDKIAVAGVALVKVTEEGETVHVAYVGHPPATTKLTVPVNPAMGVTVKVAVPVWPAAGILILLAFVDKEKSVTVILTVAEVDPV
jgi:hypothetical protein